MGRCLFGLFLSLISIKGHAQADSLFIRQIANEIFQHSTAYDNLQMLTKSIGPRLSGSPQTYISEKWGQLELIRAGADSVYLQETKIPHWVRGGRDQAAMISGGKRVRIAVIALGNSVPTGAGGVTAPMIMIKDFDELERRKNEIRGKIVFFNYAFNKDFVRTFVAYGDAVVYRAVGASRAAKYGAVGVLVRSMSESTDNIPHTGAMVYNDSFPKIPALAVGLRDADKLASLKQKDLRLYIFTLAHTLPDTVGYNVIGEWTGSEFPDQYITVGAHLDSWDPAEGAQDDGAGCVHTIEVLRALKAIGYRPRHTIRFVLFTDEENADRGAEKYLADAKAKNEKHIMAFESDGGGFTPRAFSFRATEPQFNIFRSWLPLFKPYGVSEITYDGAGADVELLNESLGIPAGQLITDSQRYFDYHHAASDVFEIVNKRELELGAINMAGLIYLTDKYGL